MVVGFILNFFIGILAYLALSAMTRMRRIDKATVAGYYGSDSAGTFVTCLGVLATAHIAYDAYMPVMLAVMEIPGCLVALYLVSRLRHQGMDALGNMPDEPGYDPNGQAARVASAANTATASHATAAGRRDRRRRCPWRRWSTTTIDNGEPAVGRVPESSSCSTRSSSTRASSSSSAASSIGFISGLQGEEVTRADDNFFVTLFQGILCLFLLEMGMTASRKLKDLKTAGWGYIAFGLLAPNLFATIGIVVAHVYSLVTHTHFELGTYVLFSVLCGAASYIAVPGGAAAGDPRGEPDPAAGRLARPDVLLQRDDRHPGLHRDRQGWS